MIEKKDHMDFLTEIANSDIAMLEEKEESYGGSWKKRGGVGAFMMLARKWDRIEKQVEREWCLSEGESTAAQIDAYDIFRHLQVDMEFRPDRDNLMDDLQDLRRYLMLVEAEMKARKANGHS